ncbi:FtsW/RodA/SpoVE family cell cycle protein [Gordonia sp. X0973]|uniref:FtsW/RodA/SpoVE family cell cycle protein n=1 Tax=Gordonia sp. X0973 TaxID=2742602 RepID=UPI0026573FD4|nr:FtsW/RodA/SpoVE family cell cycle protein [Gordonia sp. X0973]
MTGQSRARRRELVLLGLALGIVVIALLIVDGAQRQNLTVDVLKFIGAYVALYLVAHLVIRWLAPHADPLFLPIVALLNGLGMVMIHRLDLGSRQTTGDASHDAELQLLWALVGIGVFAAVLYFVRDHRTLARYAYTLGFGGLFFLALPILLPRSWATRPGEGDQAANVSKIWLSTPFFSIQPGEFAKIALIIFTAALLVSKRDLFTTAGRRIGRFDVPRARDLGPLLLAWVVAMAIFALQGDLGPSLLVYSTILVMLYVATGRIGWVVIGLSLFVVGAIVAYHQFTHLQNRVHIWQHPLSDPTNTTLQTTQSLFGLATGGLFGTGLGSGRPNIVPLANTDFIVASIGEELGLVGLAAVLCLYLVLVMRGLRAGVTVRDSFGKLLATGLAATIAIQVFVIVGGVTNLIPLTGLTTPFVSYGGSSLLANFILLALLVRISNAAREPQQQQQNAPSPTLTSMPTTAIATEGRR